MSTRTTRRGVLVAGVAGLGGVLAGCSTAPVPYDASESGNVPASGATPSASMAVTAQGAPATTATRHSKGKRKGKGKVLALAADIPVGGGVIFAAEKVVITQPVKGTFRAFSAVCTHVGCIVSQVANGTIDCPCHGSQFRVSTGAVVAGPAPAPLPRERIAVTAGKIVLL